MPTALRPRFELEEINPKIHWSLSEIEAINSDALSASCRSCGASLSWAQWLNATDFRRPSYCHHCRARILTEKSCGPAPEELLREASAPGYLDRTWYHSSSKERWLQEVQSVQRGELLIHAGDRLTALARADDAHWADELFTGSPEPLYLHSFRLRETESFLPEILDDAMDDWQSSLTEPLPMEGYSAQRGLHPAEYSLDSATPGARYYNRYEIPGTISILFAAALIEPSSLRTVLLQR